MKLSLAKKQAMGAKVSIRVMVKKLETNKKKITTQTEVRKKKIDKNIDIINRNKDVNNNNNNKNNKNSSSSRTVKNKAAGEKWWVFRCIDLQT